MDELISREAVKEMMKNHRVDFSTEKDYRTARACANAVPPARANIIYCKDCRKHNKKVGFDENFHTIWKEDACPLASWRGKAQGREFDYQFCAYGERRTE